MRFLYIRLYTGKYCLRASRGCGGRGGMGQGMKILVYSTFFVAIPLQNF